MGAQRARAAGGFILRAFAAGLLIALIASGLMYRAATADPLRRDLRFRSARWPQGAPPVRLVLLSDLHVAGPDMPPERLARLVARINPLRPDCVLIAGDFTSDKLLGRAVPTAQAVAPLAGLRPRIETIATLGNHDIWRDRGAAIAALSGVGAHVVSNGAARCGALAIGGVDDGYTGHADVAATLRAMRRIGGVPVLLSHSPDVMPQAHGVSLVLAGHTHCGQIAPPILGVVFTASNFGRRYACGVIRERGRTLVVSAGIGTSVLPLRWNAPPDYWVIDAGPLVSGPASPPG